MHGYLVHAIGIGDLAFVQQADDCIEVGISIWDKVDTKLVRNKSHSN